LAQKFNVRMRLFTFTLILSLTTLLFSAVNALAQPNATPAEMRLKAYEQRKNLAQGSVLSNLKPESIGPSVFSCRVTDLDVNPADPSKMYVAYASGGLWYTESNGTNFNPVFDQEASMTIGDIAVDWTNNIIWVGTGEANSSRSSYAGTGMYRSADGGKTWEWRGLPESHHIGRIVLHPSDPNTLWVAVLGHLYSANAERGVYKTTDGGKTWSKTLFVNENSGGIDLVMDPSNTNTLYAATWERSRRAWDFDGAGEGSGIWKSTDGGNTWALVSNASSGFPAGPNAGRIGLAAGRKNGNTILYAVIDNQNAKPKKEDKKTDALSKDQLRKMSSADFAKVSDEKVEDFLKENDFPEKYNAKKIKELVGSGKFTPMTLVEYLEDANNNLFETDYIGCELYKSEDAGKTWKRTHSDPIEQMFFTYGYYFANVRCMPENPDQVYLIGFLIIRSDDGGKTWKNINKDNVHADHHALWLNSKRPGHLINGNDGGVNISWDNGESWMLCNNPPVGQFYAIWADEATPYKVYGGAQDNGVWVGPSTYKATTDWHQSGEYPYKSLIGGDGMQVQVDPRDNQTVYTGYQFGNYFRINKLKNEFKSITPRHELGERPLRFNWQTPIWLSRHNSDVLYLGANKLYRSLNKGDNWEAISADLSLGGQKGNVPYGTLTSIHESPLKFGLLYAGSDDGLLHVSKDGGESWLKISDNLPQKLWVSRVRASAHERGRVYASLNGYRWDDFNAYAYRSDDYGQNWTRIGLNLPAEPINVIIEDPVNQDIVYVGTDHNVYVSLDRGTTFQVLNNAFPKTPVHDLVIQQKASDLLIGTHGRSMYKMDIGYLQQWSTEIMNAAIHVFAIEKKKHSRNWGKKQPYQEIKEPTLPVMLYASTAGKYNWSIKTKDGLVLNTGSEECSKGFLPFELPLSVKENMIKPYQDALQAMQKDPKKPLELEKADSGKVYLQKGSYQLVVEKEGKTSGKEFVID
jgi:photosystem II stability/assembly factor-like uncharacterized protein